MEKFENTVKIGQFIEVYHPKRGSVIMEVIGIKNNFVSCDLAGLEETVRIVPFGDSWRWECVTD